MKLLKLYSSNPKFKTIDFKPGINIVAGLQSSSSSTDTYNGIGKSSALQLVHLMLGGKLDIKKYQTDARFYKFLSGYGDFLLDLEIGSITYTIKTNFSNGIYYINDEKVGKYSTLGKKLNEKIFFNNDGDISFKQTLNCFARRYLPSRNYYTDALQQQGQPPADFYQRMTNLVLLGLDISLPKKFKKIRDEIDNIGKTKSSLAKANVNFNESELRDLEDKLEALIEDKNNFIIAKNYDDLKLEADQITEAMNEARDLIYFNDRKIRSKRSILSEDNGFSSTDIEKVERIFREAEFHFPDLVRKRLEQAEEFHLKMYNSRRSRLKKDIVSLELENSKNNEYLVKLEHKRDAILKDLDSRGALEEYNSIVERIRTLESNIADLTSFQTTVASVEKELVRLEKQKADINFLAVDYIESIKGHIELIEKKFRALVRQFYTDHGGSLNIRKNDGEAKYLFEIEPYIPKDSSQGINEVKIFCYDMLLFELNKSLLGFIAHDSFLFGGVDQRQTRTMFKVAIDRCKNNGLQYFVNINKNIYEDLVSGDGEDDILSLEDKSLLKEGTVLTLFDSKAENTLFGQYFN